VTFEERAKDVYRDMVVQAVVDSANRVVGYSNRWPIIAAALQKAYDEGLADARAAASPRERERWAFDDLQKEIGAWANMTFIAATSLSVHEKLKEEVDELGFEIRQVCRDGVGEEIADCIFALLVLAHKQDVSAIAELRRKFEINKARKWGPPNAQGVYTHVREGQA